MKRPSKKQLRTVLILVFAVIFLMCAIVMAWHFLPQYEQVPHIELTSRQQGGVSAVNSDSSAVSSLSEESLKAIAAAQEMKPKFDAAYEKNNGICAWITVPGTGVDYEIARSTAEEPEDFYLHRGPTKKYRYAGTVYMQKVNVADFTDANTVLYGHNMQNGTMFGTLRKYRQRNYFEQNNTIYVYIPGKVLTYRIFSAFVYDNRNIMYSFDFRDDEQYADFLSQITSPKSTVKQLDDSVSVTTEDRIITLSTCTGVKTQRYLVIGVLTDEQPIQ